MAVSTGSPATDSAPVAALATPRAVRTSRWPRSSRWPGWPRSAGRPQRRQRPGVPLALLVPSVLALALALAYPLGRQVVMSFQQYGLAQQFGRPPVWVGLDNYRTLVGDPYLWVVVGRSVAFCAVNAAVTMALGVLVALLMTRLSTPWRVLVQVGLLLAWAMPVLAVLTVWQWLFDGQYGVVNWVLTRLGGDFAGHSWLLEPLSFFLVATIVVVWMSVPFVAFTVYAGLTQVPEETVEAAMLDGAGSWARFRYVIVPTIRPTTPATAATLSVRRRDPLRRRLPARRRLSRAALNASALGVFVLSVFPVYWMINSSLLPRNLIRSDTPTWFPASGTLSNYGRVFEEDTFLAALRVSLTVTVLTVVVALLFAFLAALAVSRFRFRGRRGFVLAVLVIQMVPVEGLFISQYKMLESWQLLNTVAGLTLIYVASVLPFTIWTLRGFVTGVPVKLEEAAMVDGCSRLRAFWRITFPLLAPGLVATGVFGFIQAWNEFTLALVVMTRPEAQTLPVSLRTFTEDNKGADAGAIMAGSTLLAIPVVIFFLVVQGRMTAGLVTGAVKG